MENKFYVDQIHGIKALAPSRTLAWGLIRNECKKRGLKVPTMHQIEHLKYQGEVLTDKTE